MENYQVVLTVANLIAIAAVLVAVIRQAYGMGRYTRGIEDAKERLVERITGIEQSRDAIMGERAKALDMQLQQIHKRLDRIESRLDDMRTKG